MLSHVFLLKVFMIRRLVCCKSLKSNGDINTAVLFSAWVFIRSIHGNKGMTKVSYKPLCMFETSSCNGGETRASETLIWKWNGRSWTDSPIRQTISSHSLMLGALSTTQQNPVDDGVSGESLWREPMVTHHTANHITAAYCITACRGVTYTSSRGIVSHPRRRKAAVCCV